MTSALIIDCDGVLADTERYGHLVAFNQTFAQFGLPIRWSAAEYEMEMGVGIHGEPGRRREKLASANAIVDELLEAVVSDLPFSPGDNVALMINGLGGTPISELYLLYGYAHEQLARARHPRRPVLRRRVLHVAGHDGLLDHAEPPGRRDRRPALGTGRDRDPHLLSAEASGCRSRHPEAPPRGLGRRNAHVRDEITPARP